MKILLKNRSLLKISGSDSESFLQNQFSNDITKLDNSTIQLNAYCQHQGKIIGLFWVMKYDDFFLLSFPDDLITKVTPRLQMFILMSDVLIEDISSQYNQIGLLNENNSNAYLDLYLMTLCKHNIIANSTFSFWGALVGSNIDSKIIISKKFAQKLNLDFSNQFSSLIEID